MTTGIGNAVGVRKTETCLIIWTSESTEESHTPASPTSQTVNTAPIPSKEVFTSLFGADSFFDAGDQGCGEGPLDKIAGLIRKMEPGQTLEVRATDPTVKVDLPAWCRLTDNQLIQQQEDRYLIQRV